MPAKKTTRNPARVRTCASAAPPSKAVLDVLAAMPAADRRLGEGIHAIVTARAPALTPKLWYGMPAYARDGKVVLFFQAASKFKTRYATLGFMHEARLDDGTFWPVAFAVTDLTPATRSAVTALVERAAR